MKPSIINKLDSLKERYEELEALLGDASVISDQDKFRAYSKEYSQLEDVVKCFNRWNQLNSNIAEAELMLDDPEMKEMAEMEIEESKAEIEEVEQQLQILLLPKDPNDEYNCYLEIRAGTGGDEAGIFAGDLFRMYSRYAESKRWRVEMLSANESEQGGYKEVIVKVSGDGVYGQLKFESGGHRVQRVPKTESQGRIHTSACTVAVMPELPEVENIKFGLEEVVINKKILDVKYSNVVTESHKLNKMAIVKQDINFFSENVKGKTIEKLSRRGKYLYFTLNEGYIITHFGMTGAFFLVKDISEITNKNYFKHQHVIFELSTGEKLVYSDIRRFGELRYIEDVSKFKPFVNLAPEPFDKTAKKYFLDKLDENNNFISSGKS